MSDPTATLLAICRRLIDPDARPIALHAGHNGTAVLRAATTVGEVIVKCHRGEDRHRQEVYAYQHWTAALGTKAPTLIAVSEEVMTSAVVSAATRPCSRAAVRSCVEPGSAADRHCSRPAASAMTWALTPCRWCFPE